MKNMNGHVVGMVVGLLLALVHFGWSMLVMLGLAAGLLDFVFSLHFLSNPYVLQPFDWGKAVMLWVLTFVVGYVAGWLFTWVWNMKMQMMKK